MSKFGSVFGPMMDAMLNYREALGYSRASHERGSVKFR